MSRKILLVVSACSVAALLSQLGAIGLQIQSGAEGGTSGAGGHDSEWSVATIGEVVPVADQVSVADQLKAEAIAVLPAPTLRAKMVAESVEMQGNTENVRLRAVYGDSPENKDWAKYTPCGSLLLSIDNPAAQGKVPKDAEFFVDLTPVKT